MSMINIVSTVDLDCRNATGFAAFLNDYEDCNVYMHRNSDSSGREVNAKTAIGIISLVIKKGDRITISCHSSNKEREEDILNKIEDWFNL